MTGIDYRGESINVIEYERGREKEIFVCNESEYYGAKCKRNSGTRKMENRKRRVQYTEKTGVLSYYLEHRFSHDYQGMKNYYYMIQIGQMIGSMGDVVEESKTEQEAKAPMSLS